MGTPTLVQGQDTPTNTQESFLMQNARGFIGRALGRHVPHTGGRGVDPESQERGVFMEENGIGCEELKQRYGIGSFKH